MHITVHAQFTPQFGHQHFVELPLSNFPDYTYSPTFPWFWDFSPTLTEFHDINRFPEIIPEKWKPYRLANISTIYYATRWNAGHSVKLVIDSWRAWLSPTVQSTATLRSNILPPTSIIWCHCEREIDRHTTQMHYIAGFFIYNLIFFWGWYPGPLQKRPRYNGGVSMVLQLWLVPGWWTRNQHRAIMARGGFYRLLLTIH